MPQGTADAAHAVLDRLARFEPDDVPVISLYLNLQADQHGKDNYHAFVRKELAGRVRTYPEGSAARASLDRDVARITAYLDGEVPAAANGLALFAAAAHGLFDALVLDAPVPEHRLSIAPAPHLFPLELVLDQHPRHAVVQADSHHARILIFDQGQRVASASVEGEPVRRSSGGGWSQMRYQRHVDKLQADHAREIVQVLDRLVRDERVEHLLLAGDEVNLPALKKAMPPALAGKVVDELRLPAHAPEHEILRVAGEAMRRHDALSDEEAVGAALDAFRAGGLGIAGVNETLTALERGQVHELYLTVMSEFSSGDRQVSADDLVARARQTSARVRFIENPALLEDVGGVAASLRFRLNGAASENGAAEGVARS